MAPLDTVLELIKRQATLRTFSAFLKESGLPSSGSWSDLLDRASSAARNGQLTQAALVEFLGESEEYGRQHVFLYRALGQHEIPSQTKTQSWLDSKGWGAASKAPALVDLPKEPTLTHVRRDPLKGGIALTCKVVETRIYDTLVGTNELGNGRFTREYQREQVRAVNVLRLHHNGVLEARVYSHINGSRDYQQEVDSLIDFFNGLIDRTKYTAVSLGKAKRNLYESRHDLEGVVSFSGARIRNPAGINVTVACGRDQSVFADGPTDKGVHTMVKSGHAHHDELNVWWLKQPKGRPTQDVHVLMGGQLNEFAVTQQATRADYEHVFAEVSSFNK